MIVCSYFLFIAAIFGLLFAAVTLQIENNRLAGELRDSNRDKMNYKSEAACLDHQNTRLVEQNEVLQDTISRMTGRVRDARGRFVPKERATEVAEAVQKLRDLMESGVVKRGLKVEIDPQVRIDPDYIRRLKEFSVLKS